MISNEWTMVGTKPTKISASTSDGSASAALRLTDLGRNQAFIQDGPKVTPDKPEATGFRAAPSAMESPQDAERLLRETIRLAPESAQAYVDLTGLLCRLGRRQDALALLDHAEARHPAAVWPLSIRAAVLSAERLAEPALAAHAAVTAVAPHASLPWVNYADALRAVGHVEEAIAAYRKALAIDRGNGAAWWGLANLKTVRFDAEDVASMKRAIGDTGDPFQHVQLQFALGKALGDLSHYAESFEHYAEANRRRGTLVPYDPQALDDFVGMSQTLFAPDFFEGHAKPQGAGRDVIFIVGMPRSGSTLVEQILASHPMVEGLGELSELRDIATRLTGSAVADAALAQAIADLDADQCRALGETYLLSTKRHRRTDRPYFTDKLPANWQLVPLIRLILPNARIIDARRDPRACCLSIFATYFNRHTSVPTNLRDLARYYRNYMRMMDHWDAILPGRIHRVQHEALVLDCEAVVREALNFLGLPFAPECLDFHENRRPIYTPSAQQVRRPIDRRHMQYWRNYEPWLAPLTDELKADIVLPR